MYLMPLAISEWVAEGGLARFVSDILQELDREGALTACDDQYREDGWGSAAYYPLMMVKGLVYGYSVRITSSRRWPRRWQADNGDSRRPLVPSACGWPQCAHPKLFGR